MDFFGRLYFGPWRSCALKFLHMLEIDQALPAHTQMGTGVPPINFNSENLKFGLKFSILAPITSGLVEVSSQNFFPDDVPGGRGGYNFWKARPW